MAKESNFDCPYGVTTDSTGRVFVADSNNHRIQVFTAEGKFLRMFGRRGAGKGLNLPYGTSVSTITIVSLSVFTSEGKFVTSFGRSGKGPGQFDD